MVNLLADWLDLPEPGHKRSREGRRSDSVIMARLQIKLQEAFDPSRADAIFTQGVAHGSPRPPQWLLGMIRHPECHPLLHALAECHPECRLLSFAVDSARQSDQTGSTQQAAKAPGIVESFPDFVRQFEAQATALMREVATTKMPPTSDDLRAHDMLEGLCRLCCQTDYSFVYTQHILRAVGSSSAVPGGCAVPVSAANKLAQDTFSWAEQAGLSWRQLSVPAQGDGAGLAAQHLLRCVQMLGGQTVMDGALTTVDVQRLHADVVAASSTAQPTILNSLRTRKFVDSLVAALFNPDKQLETSDAALFIELLAAVATPHFPSTLKGKADKLKAESAVRSCRVACHSVARSAVGWTLESLSNAASPDSDRSTCWLDVPIASVGMLYWATLYRKATLSRSVPSPRLLLCGANRLPEIEILYACASVDRDNVHKLQALLRIALQIAIHQPALASRSVLLVADIFLLTEAVNRDTLDIADRAGRASVKDATGIDIKRHSIEILLVREASPLIWLFVVFKLKALYVLPSKSRGFWWMATQYWKLLRQCDALSARSC